MEVITISQDIIDEVNKKMIEKKKEAKKQGNKLTKQEMILLYNILNNLYDIFEPEHFGCTKDDYNSILTRLDALTE
jgi:hypothetical protein